MGHHKGASRMGRPKKLNDRALILIKNWATIDPYYKDMSRDALGEALITEIEKQGLAAPTHETMKKYIPLILIAVVFGAWMANILFIHP